MTSSELRKFFDDKDLIALLEKIDSVKFANKEYNNIEKKYDLELAKKIVRKLL
jgi:translation elongation factor EF-1alpha